MVRAVFGSEVCGVSLGMGDHFQRSCWFAAQDQVAQMNPTQNRRRIQSTRGMGVKLQPAGDRKARIFRLREMCELKVAAIEIGQEGSCLQVVGSVCLDSPAILQQGELGKVHILSGQTHGADEAVIMLSLDVSAHHVKGGPAVEVAQHSSCMRLQVECAADRHILPRECPQVGEEAFCIWAVALIVASWSKATRRRLR